MGSLFSINLNIFSLCEIIIKMAVSTAKRNSSLSLFRKSTQSGREREAKMEPNDTIFTIKKVMINTTKESEAETGSISKKTPKEVATPFPPLNLSNMLNWWPKIHKREFK